MNSKTTVLITGSNRGIGLGLLERYLLERYLAKPLHIVIAAVRNPSHLTAQPLRQLPTSLDTQLIIVKIDANIDTDAARAISELQQKLGIAHLDIIIANAGMSLLYPTVADIKIEDIKSHMQANVYGVITVYQATLELLKRSTQEIVFMIMGAYAPTKTALNWYLRHIDAENDWLNCLSIDPGHVSTELGDLGAQSVGMCEHAPTSVQESCDATMKILDKATKKQYGGKLAVFTGGFHDW